MTPETTTQASELGRDLKVQLRDGLVTLSDGKGRIVATLDGPAATAYLTVVDGRLELLATIGGDLNA